MKVVKTRIDMWEVNRNRNGNVTLKTFTNISTVLAEAEGMVVSIMAMGALHCGS